jgi:hypothetical protein
VKIGKGATKGTGNSQGKVLPSVNNSRALSEEVEDILGGYSTLRAGEGARPRRCLQD